MPRHCEHCGSVFSTGPSDKKFCNTRCRNAYHKLRRAKALAALEAQEKSTKATEIDGGGNAVVQDR